MVRLISGVIVAVILWFVIVTILDLGLRYGWPDYAAVEKAMAFTLPMMIARLLESAAASLASGYVAGRLGRHQRAALISGVTLLLLGWAGGKLGRGVPVPA